MGRPMRWLGAVLLLAGCATAVQEQWVRPGAGRIAQLAVLPFENQTPAPRAAAAATELLVNELAGTGAVGVLDPSQTADLLRRENLDVTDPARLPSAQRLGRLLRVSHVLQGSVTEYRYKPGLAETPVVGLTARLIDVTSGEIVWTASYARTGTTWFRDDGLAVVAQGIARDMAVNLAAALGGAGR